MNNVLAIINVCLVALLVLCYAYQFVFMLIAYCTKRPSYEAKKISKIAVLIAARNEENVIAGLIKCMKEQDYPQDALDVFVIADNCTDSTAAVSRAAGAVAYERFNKTEVGKGYAIDFLLKRIAEDYGDEAYDAYLIFDADNLVEPNFVTEINKTFTQGYDCVTSYRNSKNYGDNWLSAGQGMCFMRDLILLNRARMAIGGCCFVAGTGFLFSSKLCKSIGGGWPFHTLTEDGEFTIYNAINNNKMGYCDSARFYDDQPTKFSQSWNQRLRWCKGYLQIMQGYFKGLVRGIFSRRFLSCFDMTMCMAPAYILSILAVLVNIVVAIVSLATGTALIDVLIALLLGVGGAYLGLFAFGFALTISEWRELRTPAFKKILYMFTFPIFMFSFIPIAFVAIFKRDVKWTPIVHENKVSMEDLATKK